MKMAIITFLAFLFLHVKRLYIITGTTKAIADMRTSTADEANNADWLVSLNVSGEEFTQLSNCLFRMTRTLHTDDDSFA